ncbi:MAG: cation:proton antiporter [Egibacteraceae bacterium]
MTGHGAVVGAVDAEMAALFIELGALVLLLSVLGRLSSRIGLSPIPLYLVVGLLLGDDGVVDLRFSEDFIAVGAQIGVLLLLFMLGVEYSGEELRSSLVANSRAGLLDMVLNVTPGVLAGLLLGWSPVAAVVLGGVTYISSSGVIAKLLADLGQVANRETPAVLTVLVIEDLAMAVYLPVLGILLVGTGLVAGALSVGVAVGVVVGVLWLAVQYGERASAVISSHSHEIVVLTVFGTVLLLGGLAEQLEVSSAVAAFLVGIALSGQVAAQARELLEPLRDVFAAVFFLYFGFLIDPTQLPAVAGLAMALGIVTAGTKVVTGWYAAGRLGVGTKGRLRAGTALIARGEFSIVIAGLGVSAGIEPGLGALAAAYVLLMAVFGTLMARAADPLHDWLERRGWLPSGKPSPAE